MEGYKLDWRIQGQDSGFKLDGPVSFSMIDSIHSFYNRATLSYEDQFGLLQEGFYTVPGVMHQISYSFDDVKLTGMYSVDKTQSGQRIMDGVMAGRVDLNLLNNFAFQQEEKFLSFKDRISSVVRKVIDPIYSDSMGLQDINDTGNLSTWIQPGLTDAKFINNILRPNAYSFNSDNSPFFAWIGSDGKFHFRSYSSMMGGNAVANLTYRPKSSTNMNKTDESKKEAQTSVMDLRVFSKAPLVTNKETNFYYLDPMTSQASVAKDSIYNHPKAVGEQKLARLMFDSPEKVSLGFFSKAQKENRLGLQAHHFREDLLLDKIMVLLPPNFSLVSGKKVNLDAFLGLKNAQDKLASSARYSGDWLVEMSEHLWSSKEKMGFSKLLLTRQSQNVPTGYDMKDFF